MALGTAAPSFAGDHCYRRSYSYCEPKSYTYCEPKVYCEPKYIYCEPKCYDDDYCYTPKRCYTYSYSCEFNPNRKPSQRRLWRNDNFHCDACIDRRR